MVNSNNPRTAPSCYRRTIYLLIFIILGLILSLAYDKINPVKIVKKYINHGVITNNQTLKQYHIPETYAVMLYQLMKDTHELFTKHNLPYFADFGTLLGAVRHKGIVPHDDDLDIGIKIEDYPKFLSLKKEFEALGYTLQANDFNGQWTQIRYKKYKEDDGGPLLDVFPYTKTMTPLGVKYVSSAWPADNVFHYEEDLYPLKKYKFGPIEIYGPNHPRPYLSNAYGYNWDTVSYMRQPHLKQWLKKEGKPFNRPPKNRIILNGEMFEPLTIKSKLQDRVK